MHLPRSLHIRRWPLFALFLSPLRASAHMTLPGMNDTVNGVLHPYVTPTHVLVILTLAVLVGQHTREYLRLVLWIFVPCAGAALALTATHWIAGVPPPALITTALAAGATVALDRGVSRLLCGLLLGAGATAIGLDSGLETGSALTVVKTLLGTWVSLSIGIASGSYYASLAVEQKKQWLAIALRVLGSWIVAICLLMLAFSLRK